MNFTILNYFQIIYLNFLGEIFNKLCCLASHSIDSRNIHTGSNLDTTWPVKIASSLNQISTN